MAFGGSIKARERSHSEHQLVYDVAGVYSQDNASNVEWMRRIRMNGRLPCLDGWSAYMVTMRFE